MKTITLGKTGIKSPQNAFGALPIQRLDQKTAVDLLHKAYNGGMTFFDTARAYSDSEVKLGEAFDGMWENITIATKTTATSPEVFWKDLETSLHNLRTDCIDLYQFHCVAKCFQPNDGTGMYECMLEAKKQGKIKHIGITTHKIEIAKEIISSGLYETLQFPLSYLSTDKEIALVQECKKADMGFIAMKGLAGGLITNSEAAMAFMSQFENVLPIWGIQKENELNEWLSLMSQSPCMTEDIREFIEDEQRQLQGEFCRGCGYCMPCPAGIEINTCARMSLLLRRAPSENFLDETTQEKMMKINQCLNCGKCKSKCPYELNTPELLRKNLKDYQRVLAGEIKVK